VKKINLTISDEADNKFTYIQKNNNIKTRDETLVKILEYINENVIFNTR